MNTGGKMKSHRSAIAILRALGIMVCIFQTAVLALPPGSLRDPAYKKGVLQKIAGLIESKYVLAEKAKQYAAEFRKKVKTGAYSSIIDAKELANRITADLQAITHDKHVSLRKIEASDIGEEAVSALHHPVRFYRLGQKENRGFHKLEWINGHIGYLDIRRFYAIEVAREMLEAAMKFLENADAIIIDVRENGGGSGDYLSSFFLPYPTQLTGWYYRENDYTEEFWTTREMGGKPLTDVPLFVLVGKNTFSAAEIFAYDLQARKRAVLIGEPTKGGAHSIDLYKIDNLFEINISTSRAVNPVTGGNWEGTGVIPDVTVAPERALDTAIELAEKAGAEFAKARDEKLKQAVDKMQTQLDLAEKLFRGNDADAARAALDSLFRIGGEAGLVDYFFVYVLAYNYFSPKPEPILYAILEKSIELFPMFARAHLTLAETYYASGKKKLAVPYYEKALALDPGNRNIQKRLNELKDKNRP
jgi:C-terminal processing protease CtpA/Prc